MKLFLKRTLLLSFVGLFCIGAIVGSVMLIGYLTSVASGTAFETIFAYAVMFATVLGVSYCVGVVIMLVIHGMLMTKPNKTSFEQSLYAFVDSYMSDHNENDIKKTESE